VPSAATDVADEGVIDAQSRPDETGAEGRELRAAEIAVDADDVDGNDVDGDDVAVGRVVDDGTEAARRTGCSRASRFCSSIRQTSISTLPPMLMMEVPSPTALMRPMPMTPAAERIDAVDAERAAAGGDRR
jgi:hypothetical protein